MILYRKNSEQVNLDSIMPLRKVVRAKLVRAINQEDYIDISIESVEPIVFELEDKIVYDGRDYFLNLNPKIRKTNTRNFLYELRFEGLSYLLRKIKLFNRDSQGRTTDITFSLTTDLQGFIELIINNLNHRHDKWSMGIVPSNTEVKTLSFDNQNCLLALQDILQSYDSEFDIAQDSGNYIINIREQGSNLPYSFEYGKGKGLYNLTRQKADDADIVTRLYGFGSYDNLPIGYRNYSPRLRMPSSDYIQNTNLINQFGYTEDVIIFEDIRPEFKGDVTTVGALEESTLKFTCSAMDFDLKEVDSEGNTKYLIAGHPAIIYFNTGNLAGYEFEVHDYNHATKEFTIIRTEDERGLVMPDDLAFKLEAGDKFVILQIRLPQSYVTNAEIRLRAEVQKAFNSLSENNIKYLLELDPAYMKDKQLRLGDKAYLKDSQLNIDQRIRVVKYDYDILNDNYKLELTNLEKLHFSINQPPRLQLVQLKKELKLTADNTDKKFLQSEKKVTDLKESIFDPHGFIKDTNIKSESITEDKLNLDLAHKINHGEESFGWGDHSLQNYLKPIDLNGYATESWVNDQGFLTSFEDTKYTGANGIEIDINNVIRPTYGTGANTIAQGNDSRFHTHTNFTDLEAINAQVMSQWNTAFNRSVVGLSVTGDSNKTITFTKEDGSILTASFLDNNDPQHPDDVINALEYNVNNDGVLIARTLMGGLFDVNLDGRHSLIGHKHVWADITDRPTKLSQFTNDLGNYGDWITKAQGDGWYEPIFSKNSAFNKNFGTENTDVARGNHSHAILSAGDGITGSSYNGGTARTWSFDTAWGDDRYGTKAWINENRNVYTYYASAGVNLFRPIRRPDGSDIPAQRDSFKIYDITLSTAGTSTKTGYRGIIYYDNGWKVYDVSFAGKASNHPYIIIDTDGVPKVRTNHSTNYNIFVNVRVYNVGAAPVSWRDIIGISALDVKADKTISITGTGGLTGGGNLTANSTISLSADTQNDIGKGVEAYEWGNHNGNYIPFKGLYVGDVDEISFGSFGLGVSTNATNSPFSSPGGLWSMSGAINGGAGTQIIGDRYGNNLAFRGYANNSYSDWREIWHTGNFTPSNYYTKNESLNQFVGLSGVQNIADTKTFLASPVVPNPTLDAHAVNKGWVGEEINGVQGQVETFLVGSTGGRLSLGMSIYRVLSKKVDVILGGGIITAPQDLNQIFSGNLYIEIDDIPDLSSLGYSSIILNRFRVGTISREDVRADSSINYRFIELRQGSVTSSRLTSSIFLAGVNKISIKLHVSGIIIT